MVLKFRSLRFRRKIAVLLFVILGVQTFWPGLSLALGSGPVQPEAHAFEPVGTTDMVDPFTGDFVYNIPLMDVEGYPVNISYHGGVTMDQEATWVGLGWNINPGAINRAVRGLPDDFNGESIEKVFKVKPDKTTRIGLTATPEILGFGEPYLSISADLGGYLNFSNYRGVSVDFTANVGVNAHYGSYANVGINGGISVGSQTGGAINYGANCGVGFSSTVSGDMSAGASFNLNTGGNYSPRTGLKEYQGAEVKVATRNTGGRIENSFSAGTFVPMGMYNHTAVLSNRTVSEAYSGQLKLGGELFGGYLNGKIFGSYTETRFDQNGTRKGYGYFNLEKADAGGDDLLDFSREKDGMFNTTMSLLPQAALTYDIYSVSGQGTGGSFRPYRNDIGSVYDPLIESPDSKDELKIEAGLGNLFEIGGEAKHSSSKTSSGAWDRYKRPFYQPPGIGSYESYYFKEAGELTVDNESYLNGVGGKQVVIPEDMNSVPIRKAGADTRVDRANYIYNITGDTKDTNLLLDSKELVSYQTPGFASYPSITKVKIPRTDTSSALLRRRSSQVTEIVQIQKDGRRYVYGMPVLNNVQREAIFNVSGKPHDQAKYLVNYAEGADDAMSNGNGIDNYYSSTVTPTYVAAHLLTAVLSTDYVDVTGDGITDDDLGTYTKFNYSRKSKDYRWRSPVDSGKAQYIPGYVTDKRDDKGSYLIGSREEWMMHSIETKNYVAEFYVSPRNDARGLANSVLGAGPVYQDSRYTSVAADSERNSFKLDSIVLYNKHDRFINGSNAKSIKTVLFSYDYSLCPNTPNSTSGKLTLRKIQMRYGSSNVNLSAGYTFNYSDVNPEYDGASKDKWGTYKPNVASFNNFEFPFTTQSSATDSFARAWTLTQIGLPSGGVIKVDYESDDYAYVQDLEAMEMFKLRGVGISKDYDDGSELYHSPTEPNLYVYFDRRQSAENPNLTFRQNYLNETDLLYYNVPVALAGGKFEPIKGYAHVADINVCPNDATKGYIKLESQAIDGTSFNSSPIVYTALNVGRLNLPQIMFPGSDPDATDMDNIINGLKNGVGDIFNIGKEPLKHYMESLKAAKQADLSKAFVRLTSPGLMKKGGGQRVKKLRFYDNWSAMTGGQDAVYGKEYFYTKEREDKKGIISSGVASWEPIAGGDELPQRQPLKFQAQAGSGSKFPRCDAIDLYQELPIGESFFPSPIVGYSKVTSRSIHIEEGRSSQTEDINYFYTAKDFPIQTTHSTLKPVNENSFSVQNTKISDLATQGFSIVLNDMHGKPLNTEHWVLKADTASQTRELVSYQKNDYLLSGGQLKSDVPVFAYDPSLGKMSVVTRKMGLQTDITVDTRCKLEEMETEDVSLNVNSFLFGTFLLVLPLPFVWPVKNSTSFKSAAVTKIVQQYGILSKVTNYNQGAITELRNEVFDAQTGNALVTSVNNEFKDRQYSVNYPAHWAYKEMGPSYENFNRTGVFSHPIIVDTFGAYAARFLNYNPGYSSQYALPSNMPVGRVIVDNEMPNYKLGDELSLQLVGNTQPLITWVMGYTSDTNNCYLVLASREPYVATGSWSVGNTLSNVPYRVIKSGNKNRLGETIQTYTSTDPGNIYPSLKDYLPNVISLTAERYNHNLSQVFAANLSSDSLNPFVTGKVGIYRPEKAVINLKKREYIGGTVRKMGTYPTNAYWKTEIDNFASYCADTSNGDCGHLIDTLRATYFATDSIKIDLLIHSDLVCDSQRVDIYGLSGGVHYFDVNKVFYKSTPISFSFYYPTGSSSSFYLDFNNGCCTSSFVVDGTWSIVPPNITRIGVASGTGFYHETPSSGGLITKSPYRIRKKILLGKVGHYDNTDDENWVNTQNVTKYNWYGAELENKEEGIGYNSAIYGYNQQLPICVAKNARHGEVLFDGFEDYALLQAKASMRETYMKLNYSPFAALFGSLTSLGTQYQLSTLSGSSLTLTKDAAHSGYYSLKNSFKVPITVPLQISSAGVADGYTFHIDSAGKYIASIWLRPITPVVDNISQGYSASISLAMDTVTSGSSGAAQTVNFIAKSNIIDGWQLYEADFDIIHNMKKCDLSLANGYYYDDIRLYPFSSNSKAFVYHPVTRKLMATLDENNYATFYEYDAEGNLIRTKKETAQGIMTVSESRSTHFKTP